MTSKPRRVLMFGPYPPPYGGIGVVVRDLIESPLSNKVDIICIKEALSPVWPSKNMISIIKPKLLFKEINLRVKEFIQLVRASKKVDILHIHTSYDFGWIRHIFYILILKKLCPRIRVVLHLHAYDREYRGDFPYRWSKKYIFSPLVAFKLSDGIITLSPKDALRIKGYLRRIKLNVPVVTVSNGIIAERFNIASPLPNDNVVQILYFSSLERRKGIYQLIEILPRLMGISRIKIVIGGDGPARDDLLRALRTYKPTNVEYVGKVNEDVKVKIWKESDIFILQSENEGIPIAILEALASGTAIITTKVGGIPLILQENKNAILIPPQDSNSLLEAILFLVNNPKYITKMKHNNKKLSKLFSWEVKYYYIYALYQKVMSNGDEDND